MKNLQRESCRSFSDSVFFYTFAAHGRRFFVLSPEKYLKRGARTRLGERPCRFAERSRKTVLFARSFRALAGADALFPSAGKVRGSKTLVFCALRFPPSASSRIPWSLMRVAACGATVRAVASGGPPPGGGPPGPRTGHLHQMPFRIEKVILNMLRLAPSLHYSLPIIHFGRRPYRSKARGRAALP